MVAKKISFSYFYISYPAETTTQLGEPDVGYTGTMEQRWEQLEGALRDIGELPQPTTGD